MLKKFPAISFTIDGGIFFKYFILFPISFALLSLILRHAWVSDDAYISFRVVDNFVNGYGLRWNIDERVQAFTNPLWVILHIAFQYLFRNIPGDIFYITIAISCALTIAAFLIAAIKIKEPKVIILAFFLPLAISKAFLDFSTSGLETPLSFLLIAIFAVGYSNNKSLPYLTLVASLAAINRLDSILLFLPALCIFAYNERKNLQYKKLILSSSPLILWLVFSFFYYGFIFPNTKYAKLGTGLPLTYYWRQGFYYFEDLLQNHTVMAFVIFWTMAITFRKKEFLLAAGAFLYSIYIIHVGGDFMSGRFWVLPFFLCLVANSFFLKHNSYKYILAFLVGVIASNIIYADIGVPPNTVKHGHGINDEREFYAATNSLEQNLGEFKIEQQNWVKEAYQVRNSAATPVLTRKGIGIFGFYVGPAATVVDIFGLSDPLLARLPATGILRIGHFERQVPVGYMEAMQSDDLKMMNPNLAIYYGAIRDITRLPLFSADRLKTLLKFHMGYYDKYLKIYKNSLKH